MAKRVYVGVPKTYTVLDYIQSSGTQYIDTGFQSTLGWKIELDWMFTVAPTSQQRILGLEAGSSHREYLLANADKWQFGYVSGSSSVGSIVANAKYHVEMSTVSGNGYLSVDGITLSSNSAVFSEHTATNVYLFALNAGAVSNSAKGQLYSAKLYDHTGTLVRDYVPCKNSEGVIGLYDKVNGKFYTNAGTGTFTAGTATGETITTNGVARKVKKMYVGIDGTARRIKKGYVGVGGVARPFFTTGLERWGLATPLTTARDCHAATSVGNYALFGGGQQRSSSGFPMLSSVETYDKSLVKGTATNLSNGRRYFGATTVGNYAIFAGGAYSDSSAQTSVDTYDSSLTKGTATNMTYGGQYSFGCNIGNYALFSQGAVYNLNSGSFLYYQRIDTYDPSLTKGTATMGTARTYMATASGKHYALFAGGMNSNGNSGKVEAFDASLTRKVCADMSEGYQICATSVGDYCIVQALTLQFYTYDSSLTRGTIWRANNSINNSTATTLGNYALFFGGYLSSIVYAIDTSLTLTQPELLSDSTSVAASTTLGDYALVGGGMKDTYVSHNKVEVYCI